MTKYCIPVVNCEGERFPTASAACVHYGAASRPASIMKAIFTGKPAYGHLWYIDSSIDPAVLELCCRHRKLDTSDIALFVR